MSGSGATDDALERAADELAAVAAQGQADVEEPTGHDGRPAGSDIQAPHNRVSGDGVSGDGVSGAPVEVAPDDAAPAPDVEEPGQRPAPGHDAAP